MEEKDSGVVDVRVLCSSGETKGGKDEMVFGATLRLMMIKIVAARCASPRHVRQQTHQRMYLANTSGKM